MERVKLSKPGEELVMVVRGAKPETVDRTEYWLFSGGRQEVMVPASSVKTRLERMNVASATALVGKTVRFARSTKTNQGGKPYWEMDLATEAESKAGVNGEPATTLAPATAGASPVKSYTDIYGKATDYILTTIVAKYKTAKLEPTAADVRAMVGDLFTAKLRET